jgi:hypothetical protein
MHQGCAKLSEAARLAVPSTSTVLPTKKHQKGNTPTQSAPVQSAACRQLSVLCSTDRMRSCGCAHNKKADHTSASTYRTTNRTPLLTSNTAHGRSSIWQVTRCARSPTSCGVPGQPAGLQETMQPTETPLLHGSCHCPMPPADYTPPSPHCLTVAATPCLGCRVPCCRCCRRSSRFHACCCCSLNRAKPSSAPSSCTLSGVTGMRPARSWVTYAGSFLAVHSSARRRAICCSCEPLVLTSTRLPTACNLHKRAGNVRARWGGCERN